MCEKYLFLWHKLKKILQYRKEVAKRTLEIQTVKKPHVPKSSVVTGKPVLKKQNILKLC